TGPINCVNRTFAQLIVPPPTPITDEASRRRTPFGLATVHYLDTEQLPMTKRQVHQPNQPTANTQFCAMLAGHRFNEQQFISVQQFRQCTDSSKEQRLKQ